MPVDHATDIRRTLTGVVLGALIIAVLAVRGWPLLFVILIVCALGLWEFFTLFWGPRGRIPSRLCAIALGWGMLIFHALFPQQIGNISSISLLYIFCNMFLGRAELYRDLFQGPEPFGAERINQPDGFFIRAFDTEVRRIG